MTNRKTFLLSAVACSLLVSCGFLSPVDTSKQIDESQSEVLRISRTLETDAAAYSTQPRVNLTPVAVDRSPQWMREHVNIDIHRSEFDFAQNAVLRNVKVSSQFGEQVDGHLPITFRHAGTVKDALDRIAALTNYTYSVTNDVVVWSAFEGRTFFLPIAGGDYSYMIGKKSEEGSGSGSQGSMSGGMGQGTSVSGSSFDIDRDQFSNTKALEINPFVDVEAAIKGIVGNYGTVSASKATSSIFVKTTPDRMVMVADHVKQLSDNLSSQVVLDIKIIQVTTENAKDFGVNWKATKNLTRSVLEFDGESATNQFTNQIPAKFRGVRDTGSGSVDVLINALEEQANVSVLTEHRIYARSGKLSEFSISELRGYVSQSRAVATMDIGTSSELVQGILQGGNTLYAMAHVHGEQVSINLSSRTAMIGQIETIGTDTSFVQLPNVKQNDFKIEQIARSGDTIVAAAIRRQVARDKANSPIRAKLLPTYKGSSTVVEDIYVLVTPRIVRS